MLKWLGKEIGDGATDKVIEKIPNLMPEIWNKVELGISKTPGLRFLPYIYKAFDSMSEEEKVEFMKDVMIAGAKLGAKL